MLGQASCAVEFEELDLFELAAEGVFGGVEEEDTLQSVRCGEVVVVAVGVDQVL